MRAYSSGVVGRALRDPERLGRDAGAGAVEDPHREPEALSLLAEEVPGRDGAVVEQELAGGGAADAHLLLQPRDGEPRCVRLDDERGDAVVAGARVGLREHRVEAGDARVRDEPLRPVQNIVVALTPGRSREARRVGAGTGLGQRVGGQNLTRSETRQPRRPLHIGARELETERAQLLRCEEQARSGAHLRDLLDRDQGRQRARPRPADLLGEEQPEEAMLTEDLDDIPGKRVRRVDLGRPRSHPVGRDRTHEITDLPLLRGQRIPGHRTSPLVVDSVHLILAYPIVGI